MNRSRILLLIFVPVLLALAWHYLHPGRQLRAAQTRFLEAVSAKDSDAVGKLVSENYSDSWGFTASDWPALLKDLRSLVPVLQIEMLSPSYDSSNGLVEAELSTRSSLGPAAEVIQMEVDRLKTPTRFLWKRSSWHPWSWRLVSIQNPEIEVPSGYRPGSYENAAPL